MKVNKLNDNNNLSLMKVSESNDNSDVSLMKVSLKVEYFIFKTHLTI